MPTLIQGPNGLVKQARTALVFISAWDATIGQDMDTSGPFLKDGGNLYKSRTSKSLKGSLKGVVPSGKDVSQTALITALTAGTDKAVDLVPTGGYSIAIALAVMTEIKLSHDAKGTATFEASFEDNGGFTIG